MATFDQHQINFQDLSDQARDFLDHARKTLRIQNAMHASLVLSAVLAAATAVLAFPRSQRPLATAAHPQETWSSSFDGLPTCRSEGFFPSTTSCQQFYRCARSDPRSSELVRYQFECPQDQIYCRTQIACVHPWACSEECKIQSHGEETGKLLLSNGGERAGKAKVECPAFKCSRPGTFTDPHDCSRFHECESYFHDGQIKMMHTGGVCPRGEIFCPIVGACGPESACPQGCDRSCQ